MSKKMLQVLETQTSDRAIICWQLYGHGHGANKHLSSIWLYKQKKLNNIQYNMAKQP